MPYQVFPTADGFLMLSVGNDSTFERFCKGLGLEKLLSDRHLQHQC